MTNQTPRGTRGGETGRRVPMRLWLGAAFAGVSLITAASVYVFVDDSSGRTLQSQSGDLAVGKTSSLADDLGKVDKLHAANVLALSNTGNFEVWALNRHGNAFAPGQDLAGLAAVPDKSEALRVALDNRRYRASLPGNVTVAAAPVFGNRDVPVRGAVIVRADPPPALTRAFDQLRGDRLRALLIAIAIGVLVGARAEQGAIELRDLDEHVRGRRVLLRLSLEVGVGAGRRGDHDREHEPLARPDRLDVRANVDALG